MLNFLIANTAAVVATLLIVGAALLAVVRKRPAMRVARVVVRQLRRGSRK